LRKKNSIMTINFGKERPPVVGEKKDLAKKTAVVWRNGEKLDTPRKHKKKRRFGVPREKRRDGEYLTGRKEKKSGGESSLPWWGQKKKEQ